MDNGKATTALLIHALQKQFEAMTPHERAERRHQIIRTGDKFLEQRRDEVALAMRSEFHADARLDYIKDYAKAVRDLKHTDEHSSVIAFEMAKTETLWQTVQTFTSVIALCAA